MVSTVTQPLADKSLWPLSPELTYLNHGSFGVTPHAVLEAQQQLQLLNERNPMNFTLRETHHRLELARHRIAELVDADPQGLVLCGNATEAVNTVLNGQRWEPGDEILITSHGYPACWNTMLELQQRYGVLPKVITIPYPSPSLSAADEFNSETLSLVEQAITEHTRMLLIDHISSPTALIFPIAQLIKLAHKHQLLSLVDGAHAPGQLELSIRTLQPDYYIGNLHKWLFVPKSVSMLWVKEEHRTLLPLVISHGYHSPERFQHSFSWTGTRDLSARMCIPAALDFIDRELGGLQNLMSHNHQLICSVKEMLLREWWPDGLAEAPDSALLGSMLTLPLPPRITERLPFGPDPIRIPAGTMHPLQQELFEQGFEAPVITWREGLTDCGEPRLLMRVAAQAYCCLSDYQRLVAALDAIAD